MATPTTMTPIAVGPITVPAGGTVDLYTVGANGARIEYIDLVPLGLLAFEQVWDRDVSVGYNDETTDAGDVGTADVTIFRTDAQSQGDEFYVGHATKFGIISFVLSTALVGATVTLEVAYWDGAAFTALTAVDNDLADGTNVLKNSGEISFTPPSGWATTAVNGVTKYYIRLKLGTANPGTAPVGTTVKLGTLGAPLVTAYADSDVIAPSVPVSGAWATNALRGPRNFPGGTVLKAKNNAGDVVTAWVGGTDYA